MAKRGPNWAKRDPARAKRGPARANRGPPMGKEGPCTLHTAVHRVKKEGWLNGHRGTPQID